MSRSRKMLREPLRALPAIPRDTRLPLWEFPQRRTYWSRSFHGFEQGGKMARHFGTRFLVLLASLILVPKQALEQSSQILGEIELTGASKVERTSGVWVDGQYVGYMKELKGSKKILLLPGKHEITVRQDGYGDFTEDVTVRPGVKQVISVRMMKDPRFTMPSVFSEVKLDVNPARAAVFVDGLFVGHVAEFNGGGGLLIAPGHRKIIVSLPGYQAFSTEVDLAANQKFQIKTDLLKDGSPPPQLVQRN